MNEYWNLALPAVQISDNIYFVGNKGVNCHLIDTGEGLVLLDTGFPQTLYLLMKSIYDLGFRPEDIRRIFHTHGHYDHFGGTKALTVLTGAETYIGAEDLPLATGEVPLSWAEYFGYRYAEPFTPDVLLQDGDRFRFGNTEIRCIHTPGHTPGTFSFLITTAVKGKPAVAGIFGGTGLNTLESRWLKDHGFDAGMRRKYLESVRRLQREHADVRLGTHLFDSSIENGIREKAKNPQSEPFYDPEEWQRFLNAFYLRAQHFFEGDPM